MCSWLTFWKLRANCQISLGGTAVSMSRTLRALVALPGETRVFCGHEYTVPVFEAILSDTMPNLVCARPVRLGTWNMLCPWSHHANSSANAWQRPRPSGHRVCPPCLRRCRRLANWQDMPQPCFVICEPCLSGARAKSILPSFESHFGCGGGL